MRRLLIVLPAAVLFALFGVALFRADPDAQLGGPAPAFSLPDVAQPDRSISLADYRGRPVVLNFWASWCDPCREEAPALAAVARRTRVPFLGVNILDGREEALGYVDEFGVGYPSVRDATGGLADRYAVTGAPETFFVDADGRIVGRYIGAITRERLAELVDELAALPAGDSLRITGRGETRPVP